MDDIQIILYIVIVAIGLLSRAFKSKKKQASKPKPSSQPEEQQKPTMSFEELLREFEGKPKKVEEKQEEPQYESYEYDELRQDDDEIKSAYETSVKKAENYQTIDELVDLEDDRHTGNFKHFEGYEEEEQNQGNEIRSMLLNAEGAKKAIILSEIINRKY